MVQAARRTDAPGYRLEFTALERDAFRARPFVPPSQWAEDHVVVMDGPYAGSRWRNDLTPYLVGIMDTWASPDVDEVVVCAVAQSGKTRAMYNCMAWGIDRRFTNLVDSLAKAENLVMAKKLGIIRDNHVPPVNLKPRGDAAQGATQ